MDGAWQRAALPLVMLGVLRAGPRHGYAIARLLEDLGFGTVRGAVLYPALNRLVDQGFIEAEWEAGQQGPGRKMLHLTAAGRAELGRQAQAWQDFDSAVARAIGPGVEPPAGPQERIPRAGQEN
ncbi:PadR family transcriptional regulator [Ruania suaedae]|uniref:PadR family transcriptional regulator n=1 Tax=Ruania suaedae TaxID=2897774 RepID=UPI001E4FBEBF|nr:PadR family transcriptional regulator [Ruania suaedae]UFU03908.1 PadR family transcriptional regulator [Ruania suaedae]